MTIKELLERKAKLDAAILELIREFHDQSPMKITEIRYFAGDVDVESRTITEDSVYTIMSTR